jgi:mono/diheme cytochrome c family protein
MRVLCLTAVVMAAGAVAADAQGGADRGRKVYAAEKCGVCHSIGDQGNKRGPLDDVGAKLSADDIRSWIVNPAEMTAKTKAARKPAMKSYAHLAKDDVDALVIYMQSLKK